MHLSDTDIKHQFKAYRLSVVKAEADDICISDIQFFFMDTNFVVFALFFFIQMYFFHSTSVNVFSVVILFYDIGKAIVSQT